jgi:nucleotide-binding universal stress UspA family protein
VEKLLVAVDGSRHSAKVVDCAIRIARPLGAVILLVNVAQDGSVPGGYAEYAKAEKVDPSRYYEKVSEGIVNAMGSRIGDAGVKFETVMGRGNAAAFILSTTENSKASMIVLGVSGLHRMTRVASLGSITRRVVENSTVPVVLVP